MSAHVAAVEVVARAIEDAALTHLGRDLGTIHRDKIAEAALSAMDAAGFLATEQAKADVWDAAAKAWAEAMETYYEPSSTERMYWPNVANPHRPLVSRTEASA